jgi:hypothetical protein
MTVRCQYVVGKEYINTYVQSLQQSEQNEVGILLPICLDVANHQCNLNDAKQRPIKALPQPR